MAGAGGYVEVSRDEGLKLPSSEYSHAAHAMLYAKWPQKLFGKYDCKYAIMVRVLSRHCHEFSSFHVVVLTWRGVGREKMRAGEDVESDSD